MTHTKPIVGVRRRILAHMSAPVMPPKAMSTTSTSGRAPWVMQRCNAIAGDVVLQMMWNRGETARHHGYGVEGERIVVQHPDGDGMRVR